MRDDMWAQLGSEIDQSWTGLVAAFGPAANQSSAQLALLWDRRSSDISKPDSVARELAEGCKKAWAVVARIQSEPAEGVKPLDGQPALGERAQSLRKRLAPKKAASQCMHAIGSVMRAGMFEAAIDGFQDAWKNAPHAGFWAQGEALAFLCREAVNPRAGWPDSIGVERKLDLLINLPCWTLAEDEWSEIASYWRASLASLGRLAALRPAVAGRCAAIVKLSTPLWLSSVGDLEHFGRELGEDLGRMKIVGGALDALFWESLPFPAQMGIALGVKAESKLGSWAIRRTLSESLAADDATGPARRQLEDLCAALWSSFDRKAIDILESMAPPDHEGWTAAGVKRRFTGSANGSAIMQWHYVEDNWKSDTAKWARKLGAVAGVKSPERDGNGGQAWMELIQSLQALRQAEILRKSLPPKPKSKAKKLAEPKRGRI